uniref:microtubule-severing ATPase n=2 Tax=Wuchereria bancrofti TaxID=6293 RepID=A0AAF5PS12_WUCBA
MNDKNINLGKRKAFDVVNANMKKIMLHPQKLEQQNYETFNKAYLKSKQLVTEGVSIDEISRNNDEQRKRIAMEKYRVGIEYFEKALKISPERVHPEKRSEVITHREAMKRNLEATKGRLSDLEKLFPSKGNRNLQHRPVQFVPPSISKPQTTQLYSRQISSEKKNINYSNARTRSNLLKGVDDKFGGPLLNEILNQDDVKMSDIIGAETAKRALEEAVILPTVNPSLFSGLRQPAQGILLFGPPGNGKTLLARAVAGECGSTMFLNVSAASITSKWVGDAEKIVRALFQIARNGQPTIIFIDEIDSILCERNEKETEVSRRMKTEFLIQMDGMLSSKDDRLLVIGATNRPEELDSAILRRFPKRILIDVPNAVARLKLIMSLLEKTKTSFDLGLAQKQTLAERTHGYSNSDLVALCREAAMVPIRDLSRKDIKNLASTEIRPITLRDFEIAMKAIKPSTNERMLQKLRKYAATAGQSD